jgi:integrase
MIKKFYVQKPKEGYPYDRRAESYFSWGFDIWTPNGRQQGRGFPTRASASDAVKAIMESTKNNRYGIEQKETPFLIDLFQAKLNTIDAANRKHRVHCKTVFTRFLSLAPRNIRVIDLRKVHFQTYINARSQDISQSSGKLITPQTILRELVPIIAVLNSAGNYFASLEHYVPPRIPRPKVPKGRKERVLSHAEQEAILRYLYEPRKPKEDRRRFENRIRTGHFMEFCLLTLSRPGEIASMKWNQVEESYISIIGTKTRFTSDVHIRRLKITPTMSKILEARKGQGEYVFTVGGVVTPKMYEQLKLACEENGIAYGRNDKFAVSFHTTRHTGITRLLQQGVDLKTIGKLSGHSDARMTMYYSHSNTDLTDAASDLLDPKN